MQEYLQKTPLGTVMDEIGTTTALLALSLLFYVLLWGLNAASISAGLATFTLWMILRARTRKTRLHRRETQLRQRIGGELKMEEWTVRPPRRAHFETALLLSQASPLVLERTLEEGVVCTLGKGGERLLVACAQLHREEKLTPRDVAAFQRRCVEVGAARGVICGAGGVQRAAEEQARLSPQVAFIGREKMIALAGAANPAGDRQLVALGRRKRDGHNGKTWKSMALSPQRTQKYLLYGLLLLILYIVTGRSYYPLPGILCLLLMASCRVRAQRCRERLLE